MALFSDWHRISTRAILSSVFRRSQRLLAMVREVLFPIDIRFLRRELIEPCLPFLLLQMSLIALFSTLFVIEIEHDDARTDVEFPSESVLLSVRIETLDLPCA